MSGENQKLDQIIEPDIIDFGRPEPEFIDSEAYKEYYRKLALRKQYLEDKKRVSRKVLNVETSGKKSKNKLVSFVSVIIAFIGFFVVFRLLGYNLELTLLFSLIGSIITAFIVYY